MSLPLLPISVYLSCFKHINYNPYTRTIDQATSLLTPIIKSMYNNNITTDNNKLTLNSLVYHVQDTDY